MATKHVRRTYTEQDQARVAVVLQGNGGNVKRTAKDTGVPIATVRDWKRKWESEGFPKNMEELTSFVRDDFIGEATEVRWLMLEHLREKAERRELNGRDLLMGIGILTDKINVLSGMATSRTEHVELSLPDPQELAKALATFIGQTVESAVVREEEIEEAEFTETSKPILALVKET